MKFRTKPWVLAVALSLLCVLAVVAIFFYRSHGSTWTAKQMAASLPVENAVVVYADVSAIRSAGLLTLIAGTKAVEEAEYKEFVQETGFDYRSDLDRLAISFQGKSRFVVATGQFDWNRIKSYALRSGAVCVNGICEITSRDIAKANTLSFYPITARAMAVSSLQGSGGVYSIGKETEQRNRAVLSAWEVDAPVWVRVPGSIWKDAAALPAGARIFASSLAGAENTVFSIHPQGGGNGLELRLTAYCSQQDTAQKIHTELAGATALLAKMLDRDGLTPKPGDLAGLLIKGRFQAVEKRVLGSWPLDRSLLLSIFEGEVN